MLSGATSFVAFFLSISFILSIYPYFAHPAHLPYPDKFISIVLICHSETLGKKNRFFVDVLRFVPVERNFNIKKTIKHLKSHYKGDFH